MDGGVAGEAAKQRERERNTERQKQRAIASQLSSSLTNRTLNSVTLVAKKAGAARTDRALTSAKKDNTLARKKGFTKV